MFLEETSLLEYYHIHVIAQIFYLVHLNLHFHNWDFSLNINDFETYQNLNTGDDDNRILLTNL